MSLLSQARLGLPRLDPRSEDEIAADLDDEIAFHIWQLERELVEEGRDADAARAAAQARFGDVERIKRQCVRIALEERVMLQRINLVLMVAVVIVVGLVSVQVYLTQRHNTLALQAITDRLGAMTPAEAAGEVLVEGDVDRPGWYRVADADGQVTLLHELLERAGGIRETQRVTVRRAGPDGATSSSKFAADALLGERPEKVVVRAGDEIRVENESPRRPSRFARQEAKLAALVGTWRAAELEGSPAGAGTTLDVTSPDDVMNLTGSPAGTLHLAVLGADIRLVFRDDRFRGSVSNLEILDRVDEPGYQDYGRWQLDDGRLTLNIAAAGPDRGELQSPLVFEKESD
ncbi:MAG: permease prefix domain 1-containing protein [Planctomycetota bacterium]|jgi:hypothetical protein